MHKEIAHSGIPASRIYNESASWDDVLEIAKDYEAYEMYDEMFSDFWESDSIIK